MEVNHWLMKSDLHVLQLPFFFTSILPRAVIKIQNRIFEENYLLDVGNATEEMLIYLLS